ncbi:MAG: YihY/virulence factor BrkB family protein [Chitinophagaceae bacterium]|nr:YihY/virulence factor BrkB family protein [Chitinophagaceae bacterium]
MIKIVRIITQLPGISHAIAFSKKAQLPGFEGLPLYDVVRFFFKQTRKVGLTERAAAISFNFIMAIPPACIFLFSLVPLFPIADSFNREVMSVVKDITPNVATRKLVQDFLNDFFGRPRNSLLSFGFLIAVFYSSNAMMGIIRGFNRSINEIDRRGFMEHRIKAIRLTLMIMLLFIASMIILMTQGALFKWFLNLLHIKNDFIKLLIKSLRWVVIIALFFYSIAFIYRHAPNVEKKWKLVSPGSILACTLLILFTFVFSFWINNYATYNKVYGPIGTIMIIMILIYVNSLVVLIGFELNVSIKSLKTESDKRLK